jgi:hypothetical protein
MNIKVSFTPKRSEMFWAAWRFYRIYWIILLAGFVYLLEGMDYLRHPTWDRYDMYWRLSIAALYILLPFMHALINASRYRTAGPREYHLTKSDITEIGPSGEKRTIWDDFDRWRELSDAFVLSPKAGRLFILPKRGFTNEHDIAQFRRFLEDPNY